MNAAARTEQIYPNRQVFLNQKVKNPVPSKEKETIGQEMCHYIERSKKKIRPGETFPQPFRIICAERTYGISVLSQLLNLQLFQDSII